MTEREIAGNIARKHLADAGWKNEDGTALARKSYQTAVGHKDALVYLADYKDSDSFILTGEYWSEGRNCLSAESVAIPKAASPDVIEQGVMQFVLKADAAIDRTYARGLYLRRG